MKMKRNLAVILALVLAISLLAPAAAFAAASDTYKVSFEIKGPNQGDVETTRTQNYAYQAGDLKTLLVTWAGNAESVVATAFAGTNLRADFENFVAKAQGNDEEAWTALFNNVTIDKAGAVPLLKDRANTQLYQLEQYSPITATYITGGRTYTVTMTLTVDTYEEPASPSPAPAQEEEPEVTTGEDGTTAEVTKDEDGNVSEVKVEIPEDVTETTLPVETAAEDDIVYDIDIPDGKTCIVTIPLDEVKPTTVVKLIKADGTEEILPITAMTEEGLKLVLDDDVQVKVEEVEVTNDIPEDAWYKDAMDYVEARNILEDIPEEDAAPLEGCDRGTFTMMLYNMCRQPDAESDGEFTDLDPEAFYLDAVAWAKENNIIKGTSETTFDGDEPITREQIITILWRYAGEPEAPAVDTGAHDWAADAMSWAVSVGLIQGYGDDTGYRATDVANVAESATMIMRFVNELFVYAGTSN